MAFSSGGHSLNSLGGLGIIMLFIAILPNLGVAGRELYSVEGLGLAKEPITPRVRNTAKAFWKIYLGLAGLEVLLLVGSWSCLSTTPFALRLPALPQVGSLPWLTALHNTIAYW